MNVISDNNITSSPPTTLYPQGVAVLPLTWGEEVGSKGSHCPERGQVRLCKSPPKQLVFHRCCFDQQ